MENTEGSSWQRMNDLANNGDEFEAFHKTCKENQNRLKSPSTRELDLDFNQIPHPVPDRASKPTYRTEGMSRIAAFSMLYGHYRFPTDDEINCNKTHPCPLSRYSYYKGNDEITPRANKNKTQYTPLKHQTKVLDKELPLPPTPQHRVGGLKWQEELKIRAGRTRLNPNDPNIPYYTSALRRHPARTMVRTGGLAVDHLEHQDMQVAKKSLKDLGPENPFDDYYVLDYNEERELARGHGVFFPRPELERLERERQRTARGYKR